MQHRFTLPIACCVILLTCRSDGTAALKENDEEKSASGREGSFVLDLATRTATKLIGSELADPSSAKFVEIDIADVLNPKKIRLSFEVHFTPENREKLLLGSFALFPPDHPGKFIVATRGRLRSGGAIVLSMRVLDKVGPDDQVRIGVRQISFRQK